MTTETTSTATAAAEQFLARRDRFQHPAGSFDRAGRWYPSDAEWQDCCQAIRSPSRAHPYSYMVHCRTLAHVARLHDVDASAVRAEVRRLDPAAAPKRLGGETYYKAVAVIDGRYVSIFDGATEYRLGETLKQPVRSGHGGGYYVYPTLADAQDADVPASSSALDAPRAILRLRAEGQYTSYDNGKVAFSRVTPLDVVA